MADILQSLFATIRARKKAADPSNSYTAMLLSQGREKCAKKFGEESVEAIIAAMRNNKKDLICESADVLYHLMVMWAASGVTLSDVLKELKSRARQSGHAEKASRKA